MRGVILKLIAEALSNSYRAENSRAFSRAFISQENYIRINRAILHPPQEHKIMLNCINSINIITKTINGG